MPGIAQTINLNNTDEEILSGTPAPFTGVLVPESTYRSYQKQIDKYQFRLMQDESSPEDKSIDANLDVDIGSSFLKIGLGFLFGVIVGLAVKPQ